MRTGVPKHVWRAGASIYIPHSVAFNYLPVLLVSASGTQVHKWEKDFNRIALSCSNILLLNGTMQAHCQMVNTNQELSVLNGMTTVSSGNYAYKLDTYHLPSLYCPLSNIHVAVSLVISRYSLKQLRGSDWWASVGDAIIIYIKVLVNAFCR